AIEVKRSAQLVVRRNVMAVASIRRRSTKNIALEGLAAKADASVGSIMAQANLDRHARYVDHARLQVDARLAWQAAFADIDVFLMPTSFVAAFPPNVRLAQRAVGQRPSSIERL